ncbi:glycosyltransferase family 2 protein [Nocardioides jishulii]|uniref:Glycosyltransferase family 2 protein n=1 Tax=Nocardioides jishulii TaxID=2575440 RepID=A0A4V5TJT0_9ACTN|nr:glycosyltransferase family 2 protein [Nocardioides jishulii]QCX28179.1 hypothetical protein FCL41_12115 [Nocardioides jishulii]TKI60843.1 hypothetical protein FC770_15185 [Nocardioides jishulii]
MIFSVSTVLDSVAVVADFVDTNLSMGVDHMFVFLDDPGAPGQAEVAAFLGAHPHATPVACDEAWWGGERPDSLNLRQTLNANVAAWLVREQQDSWLFHFDVDEVLAIDLDVLAAVPEEFDAVHLTTLEAVSVYDLDRRETRFKTLPSDEQLEMLHAEGIIAKPAVRQYFRGHVRGKSGIRPGSGATLAVHFAVDARGKVPAYEHPTLRVLHHHTQSGPSLAAKAVRMAAAGNVVYRPGKAQVMDRLAAVAASDLREHEKEAEYRRLFDEHVADPVDRLEELGLLVHVDASRGTHEPVPLPAEAAELVRTRLASLRGESKLRFRFADGDEAAYEANSRPSRRQAGRGVEAPAEAPADDQRTGRAKRALGALRERLRG